MLANTFIYLFCSQLILGAGISRPPRVGALDASQGPQRHMTKRSDDIYQSFSIKDNYSAHGLPTVGKITPGLKDKSRENDDIYQSYEVNNDIDCSGLPETWKASLYPYNEAERTRSRTLRACVEGNRKNMSTRVGFDKPVNVPSTGGDPNSLTMRIGESPALPNGYKLVFVDEFNGNSLDRSKWSHEVNCWGGGNDEQQCYVDHPDVLTVKDGKLIMRAIYVPGGYQLGPNDKCNAEASMVADGGCTKKLPVKSSRIRTHNPANRGQGSWKYGRFEMKAKLPHGNYLWPAFWMLPTDYKYGTWAASGEFDIMESRGQNPDEVGSTLHYGSSWPKNVYSNQLFSRPGLSSEFSVYGMDWDEKAIRFYVNNIYIYQVETSRDWTSPGAKGSSPYTTPGQPWDQDFHLILNLAVGGNFFPGGKFDPNNDPKTWGQEFIIDYVKVYQGDKVGGYSKPVNQTNNAWDQEENNEQVEVEVEDERLGSPYSTSSLHF